jgi:hypothetical protein
MVGAFMARAAILPPSTDGDNEGGVMPNALIVVLVLALVAALAALIVILRRQSTAPALDENAIRRLLTETIDASSQREVIGPRSTPTDGQREPETTGGANSGGLLH